MSLRMYLIPPVYFAPVVKASLPKLVTGAGLGNRDNVESEIVISGAWYYRDGEELVIISVNIANESFSFTLSFDIAEYGINDKLLPREFSVEGTRCIVQATLEKDEIRIWKIK